MNHNESLMNHLYSASDTVIHMVKLSLWLIFHKYIQTKYSETNSSHFIHFYELKFHGVTFESVSVYMYFK